MKQFLIVLLVVIGVMAAQKPNYGIRGYAINAFRSDSTKYTAAFASGDSAYVTVVVAFDDTSIAGRGEDSCNFIYYWQRGYPCYDSAGVLDTFWHPMPLIIDTVSALTAADWRVGEYVELGADGTFADSSCVLDSVYVRGMGATGRQFSPIWSPIARVGFTGLGDNSTTKFLKVRAYVVQGVGVMTQVVK